MDKDKPITLIFPVLEYPKCCPCEQRLKMHRELDALYEEADFANPDTRKLLAAYMGVGQAIAGWMRSTVEETVTGPIVDRIVLNVIERANMDHLNKVERQIREQWNGLI